MHAPLLRLKSFLTVARARSLREAADVLQVTQPAVSKQIAQLEEELGRQLFQRHGRGMALTRAGEELLDAIGASLDHIEGTVQRMQDEDGHGSGHLSITALSTMAAYLVPQTVARLQARFPRLRLTLLVNTSVEVVELVERGKADIGVVYDMSVDSGEVEITPLHEESIAVFMKAGAFDLSRDDVHPEDLARVPLLLPQRPLALRRILERECGRTLVPAVECNTSDMVLRLARQGMGVALLPEPMPRDMVEECGMERLPLLGGRIKRRVVAITRTARTKSTLVDAALEALRLPPGSLHA